MKTVIFMLIMIMSSVAVSAENIKWYWMAPITGLNTQTEVIQYRVDLTSNWVEETKLVNQVIGMSALKGNFSNLEQLEIIVNDYLEKENIGKNFTIIDVQRIDVVNPNEILR